jgi:hypothetical protein
MNTTDRFEGYIDMDLIDNEIVITCYDKKQVICWNGKFSRAQAAGLVAALEYLVYQDGGKRGTPGKER